MFPDLSKSFVYHELWWHGSLPLSATSGRAVRRTHRLCLRCTFRSRSLLCTGAASTAGVYARIRSNRASSASVSAVHASRASRSVSRISFTSRW